MNDIYGFSGPYAWLSNMELVRIEYQGMIFKSTENAYQAMKTNDPEIRRIIASKSPRGSKVWTRNNVVTPPDWRERSLPIMLDLQRLKYVQQPYRTWLLDTDNVQIIEYNEWDDRFWGVIQVAGIEYGDNNLGKQIMQVRQEIRDGVL